MNCIPLDIVLNPARHIDRPNLLCDAFLLVKQSRGQITRPENLHPPVHQIGKTPRFIPIRTEATLCDEICARALVTTRAAIAARTGGAA